MSTRTLPRVCVLRHTWPMFRPGQSIVIREVWRGRTWTERPVVVVADTDDELVTYLAPGTRWHHASGATHGEAFIEMLLRCDWQLEERAFRPPGVQRISPWEAAFDVAALYGPSGKLTAWYVNLQQPLRRVTDGVETFDEILDLVVSPGLDAVEWKDLDEVELAVELGFWSQDYADEVRGRARAIERLITAGQPPWSTGWSDWSPPLVGET